MEQGYESDNNIIFRKKEIEENDLDKYLSDYEKRQSYKRMQIGGEPPLLGFRKPAPERPRGKCFLNLKYFILHSKLFATGIFFYLNLLLGLLLANE